jgi:hypothetical protein
LRTHAWTPLEGPVSDLASYATAMLPGKGVLILASVAISAAGQPLAVRRAWLLSGRHAWRQVARPPDAEDGAQAVAIDDHRVLFAGGRPLGDNPSQSAPPPIIYDDASNTWKITGSTGDSHRGGLLVALGADLALLVGGHGAMGDPTSECLLFDGSNWHHTQPLPGSWADYALVALPDFRVLLLGGDRREASTIRPVTDAILWSLDPGYLS